MRYGVCFGIEYPERVAIARKAGFDYIEGGFCTLSRGSDEVFEAFRKALEENDMKCEAANGFFPRDLGLLGENYDEAKVREYIENGMKRGAQIGLKKISFGSSRARAVPDNMSYADAFAQLGKVLREVIAPVCEKYFVTIVTEPLRKAECNIINTVKEGVMLSVLAGKESISSLADIYHMVEEGDTFDDVRQLKGSIKHGHISYPLQKGELRRSFPTSTDEYDYQGFVDALAFAGCDTCSVEAQTEDFEGDTMKAGKVLRALK